MSRWNTEIDELILRWLFGGAVLIFITINTYDMHKKMVDDNENNGRIFERKRVINFSFNLHILFTILNW